MRRFRPILFWIHLISGVVAGVVVLIMSVTGVLLTYQKQMTLWADLRGVEAGPPSAGAVRLTSDSLLAVIVAGEGKAPTTVVWRNGPAMPVEAQFGREGRQYLSAYTGEVVGTGSTTMRKVFTVATDWHRWLAMKDEARKTGRLITGVSNLAFLVLVLTGLWLWWPKSWTWTAFKQVLWFRRGLSPKARDFNWHNVLGIWSAVPLALIVTSGAVISFPWASNLVYRAVGEEPPAPAAATSAATPAPREARQGESRQGEAPKSVDVPVVGDVYAVASDRMPDWRTISLAWPKSDTAALAYTIDRGMGGEPHKRASLTISRTGAEPKWQPFSSQSDGRRARSIMRFLHTGEVLGFWGQTIAGLVSLAAVVLVYTGLFLTVRRFVAWRRRAGAVVPAAGETLGSVI